MTTQHPDRAVWPSSIEDVPTTAPGRVPAVEPVRRTATRPDNGIRTGPQPRDSDQRRSLVSGDRSGRRRRWRRGPAALALAALLTGASIGFGLHYTVVPPPRHTPTTTAPTASAGAAFAQRQATVNRATLPTPEIADFAGPWLGTIGGCSVDAISEAQRGNGETTRTRCTAGIVTSYWITYRNLADREAAEARYRSQAAYAAALAAGAAAPTLKSTAAGRTMQYIEYAYRIPTGNRAGQVVAAIWWSDPTKPIAGVFTCYWADLASSWAPLRDLWAQATTTPVQR
ncbi:hypothetical protein [Micromonospora parastrephiae]|uniref:hypothetical protein n=1 Tax=Micromonospora parastrephiae TaxID=2806101 RepID=UPI001EE4488F|nr:hypothetical protein [Micromonospora parastrephiae]